MGLRDLLAGIYADPAADGPRAVYADALVEHGHSLGEFIQLQLGTRRGSIKRAKEIYDPTWWTKIHPVGAIHGSLMPGAIERGFPVRFEPTGALDAWRAHATDPGWATVRIMWPGWEEELVALVLGSVRMPLLEEITCVTPLVLGVLAKTDLPIRRLAAEGEGPLPSLAHLTQLERLEWRGRRRAEDIGDGVAAAKELGVLAHIRELHLSGSETDAPVADALATLVQLPKNVERLRLGDGTFVDAGRDGSLEIGVAARHVDRLAAELAKVSVRKVTSVGVTFVGGGGFTKYNRAGAAETIREALKRFKRQRLTIDG